MKSTAFTSYIVYHVFIHSRSHRGNPNIHNVFCAIHYIYKPPLSVLKKPISEYLLDLTEWRQTLNDM